MENPVKNILSGAVLSLFFALAVIAEDEKGSKQSITEYLSLQNIDNIEIAYAPKTNWKSDDVKKINLEDKNEIEQWIALLNKIPASGPAMLVKMPAETKEYTISFYKEKKQVASLRIKGSSLDGPVKASWDFYAGTVDDEFVQAVEKKIAP
jgi:hypothetical protein